MEARSVGAPLPYVKRLIFSCLLPGLRPVLIATQQYGLFKCRHEIMRLNAVSENDCEKWKETIFGKKRRQNRKCHHL